MTSKHCFFKVMKEDFRHKIWMLALSILGNLLMIPVIYLMSEEGYNRPTAAPEVGGIAGLDAFFGRDVLVCAGIVAMCGALIVGLSSFRYLFHKNMVDTYHGIPVKRRTLFAATWLNGFLIWLVPFLAMFLLTLVMGEVKLASMREKLFAMPQLSSVLEAVDERTAYLVEHLTGGGLLLQALRSAAILIIVFLLVYHVCLLAVMLCGNILNTLTLTAFLGVGAIAVYGLAFVFCQFYLDTFLERAVTVYGKVIYASPLASAIYLLCLGVAKAGGESGGLLTPVLVNLAVAVGMGAAAFALYLHRPSELAEQGVKMKPVKYVVQVVTALASVMSGWLVFYAMAGSLRGRNEANVWGIFGGLLAGIVVFGVMDIVMNMEFKAFFRHKILMAATMAAGLLLCFAFRYDWFGYDRYLPKEKDIAEISIWLPSSGNRKISQDILSEDHSLQRLHIEDGAAAFAFLEEAVEAEKGGNFVVDWEEFYRTNKNVRIETVYAKVTLKSGREYYRKYNISSADCDALCALMQKKEFMDVNYAFTPEEIAEIKNIRISRLGSSVFEPFERVAEEFCTAYNRDLEENPDVALRGGGRCFCTISFNKRNVQVFEDMTHTREALRRQGYGVYADPLDVKDVAAIQLQLDHYYSGVNFSEVDLVEDARETFQVYNADDEGIKSGSEPKTQTLPAGADQMVEEGVEEGRIALSVTDPGEIQELLGLISYERINNYNVCVFPFKEMAGYVQLTLTDGNTYRVYLYEGELPEKYILRFGELQKALMQVQ